MRMRTHRMLLASAAVGVHSQQTFDYLIAGAGTAGLVIANRLSALPGVSVAVIEPGPDVSTNPVVQSVEFSFANFNASINFAYTSVEQPSVNGRKLNYRAGKAIGGSSAVNGMVYIRGEKEQYDVWEQLGNPGWNWDSIFAQDLGLEDFTVPTPAQVASGASYDPKLHGESGPLSVGFPFALSNDTDFYTRSRDTFKALGIAPIEDINGGNTHGFVLAPQTLDRDANVRDDSARAFYEPVQGRSNLKIIQGSVRRITWAKNNGANAVASGFEYVDASGNLVTIRARKEVVLSASAYVSPLILEASGVGNPKILKPLGIPTKVALPGVGESMQDHQSIVTSYATSRNITGHTPYAALVTAHDVFGDQTAAIAASTHKELAAWAKSASQAINGAISPEAIQKRYQLQHDLIFRDNVTIAQLFPSNSVTAVTAQYWTTMAFSWGNVHLSAANTTDPVIDPKLMSVDFDAQMLSAVGRFSQKAYSTAPLSDLFTTNVSPGYTALPLDATDAQWASFLASTVTNGLHVVGTCAMVARELGGVVDSRTKVYGTQNVRVVDASIIPMELSGHTTAPLYGVAERAASLIAADAGKW